MFGGVFFAMDIWVIANKTGQAAATTNSTKLSVAEWKIPRNSWHHISATVLNIFNNKSLII